MSGLAIIIGVGSLAWATLLACRSDRPYLAVGYFTLCGIGCIVGGLLV